MWYDYILGQWKIRKYDEAKVRSRVPRYITLEQAEIILATPQDSFLPTLQIEEVGV